MTTSLSLENFYKSHPWPDKCGINSLFRFYKIDSSRAEHLKHLFIKRKLYHSLPSQFNDPFECKPHFSVPKKTKVREIRQHLIELLKKEGHNKREAKTLVSQNMNKTQFVQETISGAAQITFANLRVCSFTTRKDNLLFWSHYADSHKGFCVELDATIPPISYAFKVKYENNYPEVIYPMPKDATALIPVLVKSEVWKYEEEFRTILIPGAESQPANDGESLILNGNDIKNVYLGSKIDENKKEFLIDLVEQSDFNPGIWITSLAESTFSLKFTKVGGR